MAPRNHNTSPAGGAQLGPQSLPLDGFTRWAGLKHIVPLSHEAVRQRELNGRFPRRVKLGSARCVAWPNRELHRWLADPAGYRAED
ncbi:putative DNA-binding transcriptional regulator AlpA [Paraburkholderia phenoliruptrix]|uniref:helix-turn-helix transcriptional regulator n=1 Tax=Paraburkholderia phenoliruptrix TaxID=252970 RepID=UPI00285D50DC|nr:AlpA family phage regulatory protein [Paraburkholderia phenoliruptrix]MDR6419895.1 putative DNA-binding transcriptional regulator AlpA [Paraburkholderia phenoliruptrix]